MKKGLFTCFCFYSLITYSLAGNYGGGTGEIAHPYMLSEPNHLIELSDTSSDWNKYFAMSNDIDLADCNEINFQPIGTQYTPFTGVFDGNDHTLSNFTYSSNYLDNIGLFGYVNNDNSIIRNLKLNNWRINAGNGNQVGGLIGRLYQGNIENCHISNCHINSTGSKVGGLIGSNVRYNIIDNCSADGNIYGFDFVGGLIGLMGDGGKIRNCSANVNVFGSHTDCGGLVGYNHASIYNSYATGKVEGVADVGGLIGNQRSGDIQQCFTTGKVTGQRSGGLIGWVDGSNPIRNCYSTGDVTGTGSWGVGGFVGDVGQNANLKIYNCYSTGWGYCPYFR